MAEVGFYHLQRWSLEEALPDLLQKVLDRGLRAVVLTGSAAQAEALSQHLWTWRRDGFLPHGTRADGNAEEQPVYLTEREENPNGAALLVAVDGAPLEFLAGFERCFDLFDGKDEAALAAARRRWAQARAAGHALTYWQQGERGWARKADA